MKYIAWVLATDKLIGHHCNYIIETFKYEAKVLEEHILRHEIIHAVLNLLVKSK